MSEDLSRGTRCGLCYWACYDGDYCQNPDCSSYCKTPPSKLKLSTVEAMVLIKWKHGKLVEPFSKRKKKP